MLEDQEFKGFLKALGARIKQLRKAKGLDMRDIMIASGYYDAQWRKYEAGGSMNVASLMRVALALDVSLVELFDGLGQWPKLSVKDIEWQRSAKAVLSEAPREDGSALLLPTPDKTRHKAKMPGVKPSVPKTGQKAGIPATSPTSRRIKE